MPPLGASEEQRLAFERPFNRRARFRYQRHAGPDDDGFTRWRCPFHSGFVRSRELPQTMRRSRIAPLVELSPGTTCCTGILSASPESLPHWQPLIPGTTAWRKSMGRRQSAEAANAGLKGQFVDINRGFFRVFGLTKITLLLAFTIVGYNLERIRSFLAKMVTLVKEARLTRTRRRRGTWAEVLDDREARPGRDPPRG
jgi:hypothetical protein